MTLLLPGILVACAGEAPLETNAQEATEPNDSQVVERSRDSVASPEQLRQREATAIERFGTQLPQIKEQSALSQDELKEQAIQLAQQRLEAKTRATAKTLELPDSVADEMVATLTANLAARTRLSEYRQAHGLSMSQLIERAKAGDGEADALLEGAHPAALDSSLQQIMGRDGYSRYVSFRRTRFESVGAVPATVRTAPQSAE